MQIIDLSHRILENMPMFPGMRQPQITDEFTIGKDGFNEKSLSLYTHCGTHLDAPAHIIAGAKTLDEFSVDMFVGPAVLLDATSPEIDIDDLTPHQTTIRSCDYLLFRTGWGKLWGKDGYFSDYPVLSEQAALWLCDFGLKGVGFDTVSADSVDSKSLPIHNTLLGKGMVIVENLANLDALQSNRFVFSCFPLKIGNADGSPVRAVAIFKTSKDPHLRTPDLLGF